MCAHVVCEGGINGPTSWNVCACMWRVGGYEHTNGICVSAHVCMFMEGGGS